MTEPVNAYVHLRAEGMSVVLDLSAGRPPAILHSDELNDVALGLPPGFRAVADEVGVELPGSVLMAAGLTDAPVNPDHTVIYLVDAVD